VSKIYARESYEGAVGGWFDGRLGQAYDAIDQAFRERGLLDDAKRALAEIETLDELLKSEAEAPHLEALAKIRGEKS
jgi:hypothetical protein